MATSPRVEVSIEMLAYGGDGLGRLPDGRAIFVPFTLPGERLLVEIVDDRSRYARGRAVEVLAPEAGRIAPRCRHFGTCGGCHYQHMSYPAQVAAKKSILAEQLTRLAGFTELPVVDFVPSPSPWNYRNHLQFQLDPNGRLGFVRGDSQEVLPIQECHLPLQAIGTVWPQLDFEAMPEIERVGLRAGLDDEVMLVLESDSPLTPELTVEELSLSAVHLSPLGSIVMAGSGEGWIEVAGREFRVSAGSFFQANAAVAEAMVEHILVRLPWDQIESAIDVYCGVGLFSAFIAPQVKRLAGIEANPYACDDFAANLDACEHVELYAAPAEEVLPYLDMAPDLVLVDPPRAGLSRTVLAGITKLNPQHLVYVSCDPATLARDAKHLRTSGYELKSITGFDMFPQTYHIESITCWEKRGSK